MRPRSAASLLAALVALIALAAGAGGGGVSDAAVSYTLSGTVTEVCGHARCAPLPAGERLKVGISDSAEVASVPVDSSGHYSVSLPAGGYFVTPSVGTGPVVVERFTPEQTMVELQSDQTANFTYTIEEPKPLGYLHLSGPPAKVPVTSFEQPHGRQGHGFGPLELVTADVALQPELAASLAGGKVYTVATFETVKTPARRRALTIVMHEATLSGEQLIDRGTAVRHSLVAKEGSLTVR